MIQFSYGLNVKLALLIIVRVHAALTQDQITIVWDLDGVLGDEKIAVGHAAYLFF